MAPQQTSALFLIVLAGVLGIAFSLVMLWRPKVGSALALAAALASVWRPSLLSSIISALGGPTPRTAERADLAPRPTGSSGASAGGFERAPGEPPALSVARPSPNRPANRTSITIEHRPDVAWDASRRYGDVKSGSASWWSGAPNAPAGLPPMPSMSTSYGGYAVSAGGVASGACGSSRGGG
jgi:hypothetical protein